MQDVLAPQGAVYLRPEAFALLDALLAERLGPRASKIEKAKYLGIAYTSLWRLQPGKGNGRRPTGRFRPDNRLIGNLLLRFPTVDFHDLFEAGPADSDVAA